MESNDPRVYFAAERTLLAWVRTALAIIGLGFVIARFGLVLDLNQAAVDSTDKRMSTAIGVALVILGSGSSIAASLQFQRYVRMLPAADRPKRYTLSLSPVVGYLLALIGSILAGYLMVK